VYAILSRKSHVLDKNKNGLLVIAGYDKFQSDDTDKINSLYLFAR